MIWRRHLAETPVALAVWIGRFLAHAAPSPSRALNGGDSVWRHSLLDHALLQPTAAQRHPEWVQRGNRTEGKIPAG